MNWDNQLSHIISAADGSVAKIRERLAMPGRLSREREDVYPVRDLSHASALELPVHLSGAVQWNDLAAVQAQLHNQRQTIESLTQNLRSVERERDAQQRQIQTLQEEMRRLRERLEDREKERERKQDIEEDKVPAVAIRLEQWKREVGRELSALRGHIDRVTSLGNREESFSSKLCREEVEQLRREVDLLKIKLMRYEEDMYQQQSEARETMRQCERSCKTLETVSDAYHTNGFELSRIISRYQHTQQDVRDLRFTVSGLKDEVRSLILRDRFDTPAEMLRKSNALEAAVAVETSPRRQLLSDSDDELSPTPSLGDVSSDDLDASWLGESAPKLRSQGRVARSSLSGSDISNTASGHGRNNSDRDGIVRGDSDSSPDLSLCDL
ncbi:cingulin-like protein 1 isoform X2 [Tachysurus fulvidraco]|nr:cingulin-like protein 1 isoform X2 [Tachysurus fulvidraco]XP_027010935.2 cingulin-like protein 1 isoform X2 [Tachysurus fulvidraco]XP_047657664.1 cingulin-like protein 1 isoform X2 [Tachysurus fulvidraco]XP_047657665.1 cingulin-like protein 1 isoform X2 [Tachysurus fulvidraco]